MRKIGWVNAFENKIQRQYAKFEALGTVKKFAIIALICFFILYLSKGPPPGQDHFVYLASSFLHGRLGLTGSGTALAELVNHNGNYYVVYPPMPAILLLPFVAVFGTSVDQSLMSIALASLCCSLIWLMLTKTGTKGSKALWLTALFGFGTCFWFIAAVGSAWYIEQVTAVLFLTSAILLALYKRNDFFVGFLLGCAYLARLPTILAFPFFLLLIYEHNDAWKPRFKQAAYFLVGLAIPVILNGLYNYARYETFLDVGYTLIIKGDPNYTNGLFSLAYIPRNLYAIFFQGPILLNTFPYFKPNWMGLGLFFTTPAFLLIFKGPWDKLSKKAALAVLCILPILITHGEVGFTQFGYRFSLDFTPFLMLLTAKGMSGKLTWQEKALIILCLLINLWGVVAIIKFNFVSF
jgi:4-amino-4-deoxy-L-arabinose transferase-like glycosyltransferase